MRIVEGMAVRVRRGDMAGYVGTVRRVLEAGTPPRARVWFDMRGKPDTHGRDWDECDAWIPIADLDDGGSSL